jgi:RNA polymerase sigma factor (sigma-70 family)
MQAGTFGLVEAIKKFDTSKPFKFSTYATHWIRRYLKDERVKSNTGKPVLTNAAVTIWYHYSRVQRNQPAPLSYAEVFAIISQLPQMKFLSFDTFCDTIRTMEAISYSLDYDSDSGIDILSDLPEYYDDEFQPVRDALSTLDPRTRRVISAFFGLDCQKLSLEDIGLEIGVTRERVRQIKERGVKEIRQYISRKPKLRYTGVA